MGGGTAHLLLDSTRWNAEGRLHAGVRVDHNSFASPMRGNLRQQFVTSFGFGAKAAALPASRSLSRRPHRTLCKCAEELTNQRRAQIRSGLRESEVEKNEHAAVRVLH